MPTESQSGTDLTFFRFSGSTRAARHQQHFAHELARRGRTSLGYWRDRLRKAGGIPARSPKSMAA